MMTFPFMIWKMGMEMKLSGTEHAWHGSMAGTNQWLLCIGTGFDHQ